TATATSLIPGTYNVVVTDQNGCSQNANTTVNNIPEGTATATLVQDVSCNAACDGEATVTMTGTGTMPYTYEWYNAATGNPIGQTTQTANALCAGDYYVIVTDVNTCQSTSNTITVSEPTALSLIITTTPTTCSGTCDAQATATVTGGTGAYAYLWDDALSQITANAAGLCAQTYNVTVTDDNGCTITDATTISTPNPILIDSTVVNANCGQADGQACVIASGGTPTYSYLWPDGSTNSCNTGLLAGTYIVQIMDNNGCIELISVEVGDNGGPSADIIAQTAVSCNGGNDGSGTVDMTGGNGNTFNVLWDAAAGSQTTPTASNLAAGTYAVTITDDLGCNASTSVTITEPTALATNPISTDPICFGYSDGTATMNVIGGTPGYTYAWTDNTGATLPSNSSVINGLASGNYNVIVTDANGCTIIGNYTLTDPAQVQGTITETMVSCNGSCDGTATATGTVGVIPFQYSWDDPVGQTTQTAVSLCPGNYTATITDADGCSNTVSTVITEPQVLTASITIFGNVTCNGACDGFAQVDVLGGTAPYTYSWNNAAGANQIATNLCPNTYIVTVTDANGCSTNATISITEPLPLSLTSNTTHNLCYQDCQGIAQVFVTGGNGGYTYQWDDPNFSTTSLANNLCAGTYTCLTTDALGCQISETVLITEPAKVIINANITQSNCGQANGQICTNIFGGISPYVYQWNDPLTTTTSCLSNISAGCYDIIVQDANGCVYDSTFCFSDILGPNVSAIQAVDVTCFGAMDGSVEFNSTGGTAPVTFDLNAGLSSTLITNNLNGGTYNFIATDAAGCVGTAQLFVNEPNQLNSAITNSNDVNCFLGNDGDATVSANGGTAPYAYNWIPTGQTTQTATNLTSGNYTVDVTDDNNCTVSSSIFITEPTQLAVSVASTVEPSCTFSADGEIHLNVVGGTLPYNYTWTPNVASGPTGVGLTAGTYTIDVSDGNGCVETINVTLTDPLPVVLATTTINSTSTQCNGGATV
ncbi:MAG: SprB repeat-containing protein, partial [Alteromonas sp.]|nr:SprB repeat-containing protein [Alteromonas sp.]